MELTYECLYLHTKSSLIVVLYINEVIDPKFYTANVSTVFLSNKIFDTVNYLHIAKLVKYT